MTGAGRAAGGEDHVGDVEGGEAAVEWGGVERHLEVTVGDPWAWWVGKRVGWPHCPAWGSLIFW